MQSLMNILTISMLLIWGNPTGLDRTAMMLCGFWPWHWTTPSLVCRCIAMWLSGVPSE